MLLSFQVHLRDVQEVSRRFTTLRREGARHLEPVEPQNERTTIKIIRRHSDHVET
jgi:hypothetical protein